MVREAAVRRQRLVDVGGECADQAIGQYHATHHIVGEGIGDGGPDQLVDEARPERSVSHGGASLGAREQRFGDRREEGSRQGRCARVEGVPGRRVAAERGRGGGGIHVVDEQATGATRLRRVRRVAASGQGDRETEVADDPLGKQGHQVGVSRQPGIHPLEGRRRYRRSTDVRQPLEHGHALAGEGEVCGGGEAVVATADNDDITAVRHTGIHLTIVIGR